MEPNPPASLWLASAESLPDSPTPSTDPDAVVVGGGIAGVCAGLHLARQGVRVLLLEAGEIAGRASGRNDGQLLLGLGEHYNRIVSQFGDEPARRLWDFIEANHTGMVEELTQGSVPCSLEERGGLRLAQTLHEWAELEEASALLRAQGLVHELIPANDLARWLPAAEGFHGALHLPGEAIVQPAQMTRGLLGLAVSRGLQLRQNTRVTKLVADGDQWVVHSPTGTFTTHAVVLATSGLAPELDGSGFLDRTLFPYRGQIHTTDPLPDPVQQGFGPYAMSSNFCYEYFRMSGGRYVVGGMRWAVKGQEEHTVDDTVCNPDVEAALRRYTDTHFPSLRDHPFTTGWTGIMCGTPDGLPLVGGIPNRPGLFVCGAFNGYGLSFAWNGGRLLADLVVEGRSRDPAAGMFSPRRFI